MNIKGDCFLVRCDVSVFKEFPPVPYPELNWHFGELLASQVGADVALKVGGELFTAHKYLLAARSSVFKAQLFTGPGNKEKGTEAQVLQVDNMEPSVFRAFLHYIYTDMLLETDDSVFSWAQQLVGAANRYKVEKLKRICEVILLKHIDASTAATMLLWAKKHDCHRLKAACVEFLKDLLESVQMSADDQSRSDP